MNKNLSKKHRSTHLTLWFMLLGIIVSIHTSDFEAIHNSTQKLFCVSTLLWFESQLNYLHVHRAFILLMLRWFLYFWCENLWLALSFSFCFVLKLYEWLKTQSPRLALWLLPLLGFFPSCNQVAPSFTFMLYQQNYFKPKMRHLLTGSVRPREK